MKQFLTAVLLLVSSATFLFANNSEDLNFISRLKYFGMCSSSSCNINPSSHRDFKLLQDTSNNKIANICINGASIEDLKNAQIEDIEDRIDKLIKGNILIIRDEKYYLSFPVLVGERRELLSKIVKEKAAELTPKVEPIFDQLKKAVNNREEILFHLFWSRVLDCLWDQAWKEVSSQELSGKMAWIIYPDHPYTVGTNYNNSIAITWGPNCEKHIEQIDNINNCLKYCVWGWDIPQEKKETLKKYGCLDSNNKKLFFYYRSGDKFDKLFDKLTSNYAQIVAQAYDYKKLSQTFNTDLYSIFIIILHETAYEIFANLDHSGKLNFPNVLKGGASPKDYVQLFSIVAEKKPSHNSQQKIEAQDLFFQNYWHGTPTIVEKFREVIKKDPRDQKILLYLGMSLHDLKEYRQAIAVFQQLNKVTTNLKDKESIRYHDWAHNWMGQMHDLLGEREEAIKEYQKALSSTLYITHSQYQIGPITAGEWAKQRIETPFSRK